jgi:mono/diheme cytochrome c family protein
MMVIPIFILVQGSKCIACHANFGSLDNASDWINATKNGKRYVVPGDPENSMIYYRLKGSDGPNGNKDMPLGGNMSADELAGVKNWIAGLEPEEMIKVNEINGVGNSGSYTIGVQTAGNPSKVKIEVYSSNGQKVFEQEDSTAPFNFNFNSSNYPDGNYTIRALAYDITDTIQDSLDQNFSIDNIQNSPFDEFLSVVQSSQCIACHQVFGELNTEAAWKTATFGNGTRYIKGAEADESPIYYRMINSMGGNGPKNMPLGGSAVSNTELGRVKSWIDQLPPDPVLGIQNITGLTGQGVMNVQINVVGGTPDYTMLKIINPDNNQVFTGNSANAPYTYTVDSNQYVDGNYTARAEIYTGNTLVSVLEQSFSINNNIDTGPGAGNGNIRGVKPRMGDRLFVGDTLIAIFGTQVTPAVTQIFNAIGDFGGSLDTGTASYTNNGSHEYPLLAYMTDSHRNNYITAPMVDPATAREGYLINSCLQIFNDYESRVNAAISGAGVNINSNLNKNDAEKLYRLFYPLESLDNETWGLMQQLGNHYNQNDDAWRKLLFLYCISPNWALF